MRLNPDARMIKVDKAKLIEQIKANKDKHIKEYAEAVEAFKKEANDQLAKARRSLTKGEWDKITLRLTIPEDRAAEYDKILQTFEWKLEDQVELSQGEFNEYVLDELPFAIKSHASNLMYTQKWK